MAVGQEHRIVTKALIAARRPNQRAVDAALEFLDVTIGPGHAQRGDEMRLAALRRRRAALAEFFLDRRHGPGKIPLGPGPARRMDTRRAVERIDHQARIVGKGGQAGRLGRRFRLDMRVIAKRHSEFFRLRETKFTSRCGVDAVGCKEAAHLGKFSAIMRGDDETAGDAAMIHAPHITAIFCKSMSLPTPLRASANSVVSCSSENGIFSAVACTSTIWPEPVRTKLASVSACESSA